LRPHQLASLSLATFAVVSDSSFEAAICIAPLMAAYLSDGQLTAILSLYQFSAKIPTLRPSKPMDEGVRFQALCR
tara:strand:- start:688 stop:912 length:225 start_codon:yes stop_codon:yes gene_type:complete